MAPILTYKAIVNTRERIVQAADELFYKNGFEHTSFQDIADAVQISRGNFYYHFKTKDEILDAVISYRLEYTRSLLDTWQCDDDKPDERIRSFINILIMNRVKIKQYGCPVGTLCSELSKLDHSLQHEANELFRLFRNWLKSQFRLLGFKSRADKLAMHVLAQSQGIATLANAFHDEAFLKYEVKQLNSWLDSVINERL